MEQHSQIVEALAKELDISPELATHILAIAAGSGTSSTDTLKAEGMPIPTVFEKTEGK